MSWHKAQESPCQREREGHYHGLRRKEGREVGRSGGSPRIIPDSGTHEPPSELQEGNSQGEEGDCKAPLEARGNWLVLNAGKPNVRCAFISY